MRLPFDDEIDWPRHVVIVPERDLDSVGERVLAFHQALTQESLKSLRQANRDLWHTYFTPLAFYRRVIERAAKQSQSANGGG